MIDADHLPHPAYLEEMIVENNAMLNKVLHNQTTILELAREAYKISYFSFYKRWPNEAEYAAMGESADKLFEVQKKVVSEIYTKTLTKVKAHHASR